MLHFYLVRQDSDTRFVVSKWDSGVLPLVTYKVDILPSKRSRCTCPSGRYRGYCRHTKMVKEWQARGSRYEEITMTEEAVST